MDASLPGRQEAILKAEAHKARRRFSAAMHILQQLRTEDVQESLVVLFAKSINDVRGAQAFMVDKAKYLECLRLRKRVCAEFADVLVDEAAIAAWPAAGVPAPIMACAQALPEAASLRAREDGPGRVRGAVHAREDALGVDAEEEAVADERSKRRMGQRSIRRPATWGRRA